MTGLEVYRRGVGRWQQYCAERRWAGKARGNFKPMLDFIAESIDEALAEARNSGYATAVTAADDFSEGVASP